MYAVRGLITTGRRFARAQAPAVAVQRTVRVAAAPLRIECNKKVWSLYVEVFNCVAGPVPRHLPLQLCSKFILLLISVRGMPRRAPGAALYVRDKGTSVSNLTRRRTGATSHSELSEGYLGPFCFRYTFPQVIKRQQIVLTSTVPNLGKEGELVAVRNGYFRNYLLPQARLAAKRMSDSHRNPRHRHARCVAPGAPCGLLLQSS